jgi:hypothetical protein
MKQTKTRQLRVLLRLGVGHVEEATSEKKRLRPRLMPLLLSNNFFIAFLLKPNYCVAP